MTSELVAHAGFHCLSNKCHRNEHQRSHWTNIWNAKKAPPTATQSHTHSHTCTMHNAHTNTFNHLFMSHVNDWNVLCIRGTTTHICGEGGVGNAFFFSLFSGKIQMNANVTTSDLYVCANFDIHALLLYSAYGKSNLHPCSVLSWAELCWAGLCCMCAIAILHTFVCVCSSWFEYMFDTVTVTRNAPMKLMKTLKRCARRSLVLHLIKLKLIITIR